MFWWTVWTVAAVYAAMVLAFAYELKHAHVVRAPRRKDSPRAARAEGKLFVTWDFPSRSTKSSCI